MNKSYEKILSFIIKDNKLLLLLGNNNDPQFQESFWYVVTGGKEKEDSSLLDTVKREIKEETDLNIERIIDMNWSFEYKSLGKKCIEHAFVSYTNDDNVLLNEENIDYKWCSLEEFLDLIKWYYDKKELSEKLKKYLK